jgi:hypothetical protein
LNQNANTPSQVCNENAGIGAIANAPPVRRLNEIGADKREIFWQTNWNQRRCTMISVGFSFGFPK